MPYFSTKKDAEMAEFLNTCRFQISGNTEIQNIIRIGDHKDGVCFHLYCQARASRSTLPNLIFKG